MNTLLLLVLKLAQTIPHVNKSYIAYLTRPQCTSFYINPTTTKEIEEEISKLNTNKASGPYSIPVKLLKILTTVLSYPLNYLFNLSFSSGVVPDMIKIARVIPVYKAGCHTVMSNYRPISLLSIFHKLLEKLMYKRLIKFLEKNNILNENQFGFRSNRSTTQAILLIADKIQRAIEDKKISCGIFLDLSKAFDTVDHCILLKKLDYYGIRGIANDWFQSYLSNRKQFVTIGSASSEPQLMTCGVPQGSVLGPLLFLLYINDFNKASSVLDLHLFADDSNLFFSHKNLQTLESIVNNELSNIHEWLCANRLSLNTDKINYVLFHTVQKHITDCFSLKLNNKQISKKKCIKYLGVLIDSHLNWKEHILNLSKKLSKSIGIICKLRHFVNIQTLIQLYYAIVFPFLTYGY